MIETWRRRHAHATVLILVESKSLGFDMTIRQGSGHNGTVEKPILLMAALPIYGHTMPMRAIARALIRLGFSVNFVSSPHYRTAMENIGATFLPLTGYCALSESMLIERFPERASLVDQQVANFDAEHLFVRSIPSQYESIQAALQTVKEREPGKKVVQIVDCGFLGAMASILNPSGIKPDAHITMGVLPLAVTSIDTAPFGPGLPPDSSPAGRARNTALHVANREKLSGLQDLFCELLASVGAYTNEFLFDAGVTLPDRYIQMCIPEIEYPRSDLPPNVRYAGGLPRGSRDPSTSFPPFWNEIMRISKTREKNIVAVSQGTFATLPSQLLLPTLSALSHKEDVLVIAILGARGASLPPEIVIPSNVRVADFIPYDEILPYCDVFVTNGGYGALQHAIANGTPLVIAGSTEDKPENAARVQFAGIGVNLSTGSPSAAMLRVAVEKVIEDISFKEKVMSMKLSTEKLDPIAFIAEQIMECVA